MEGIKCVVGRGGGECGRGGMNVGCGRVQVSRVGQSR